MSEFTCLECNKKFDNKRSFHAHLKAHALTIGDYYVKHYERKDLCSYCCKKRITEDKKQEYKKLWNKHKGNFKATAEQGWDMFTNDLVPWFKETMTKPGLPD